MIDVGTRLEESGWYQGAIVRTEDTYPLLNSVLESNPAQSNKINLIKAVLHSLKQLVSRKILSSNPVKCKPFLKCTNKSEFLADTDRIVLIVASQSCDVANNNIVGDPFIEFSLGRIIEKMNGNLAFNKNPRTLHTELQYRTENLDISKNIIVELFVYEKIQIDKLELLSYSPDNNRLLVNKQLKGFVSWHSARYSRPALPTTFNNLISEADPKNKRKKKIKSIDSMLSGIYVEILPDKEIAQGETYNVNLLGLIAADFNDDLENTKKLIEEYAQLMKDAGMDVHTSVLKEDEISVATLKHFKRFYYDDLSYKNTTALPPETEIIL